MVGPAQHRHQHQGRAPSSRCRSPTFRRGVRPPGRGWTRRRCTARSAKTTAPHHVARGAPSVRDIVRAPLKRHTTIALASASAAPPSAHPVKATDPTASPCHSPMTPSMSTTARLDPGQPPRPPGVPMPAGIPGDRNRPSGPIRGSGPRLRSRRRRDGDGHPEMVGMRWSPNRPKTDTVGRQSCYEGGSLICPSSSAQRKKGSPGWGAARTTAGIWRPAWEPPPPWWPRDGPGPPGTR